MLAEAVIETSTFEVEELAAATELLKKDELLWPRFVMDYDEEALLKSSGEKYLRLQQAKEMITDSMQLFISNLTRIIEYQVTRSHQSNVPLNIKEIVITGGGAQVKGIDMLISNEMSIPVHIKNEITEVVLVGEQHVQAKRLPEFINCFGAAIAPVNFIPQDFIVTEQKRDFWKLYAALIGGAAILSALLWFFGYQNYKQVVKDQERLENGIASMSYIEAKNNEYLSLTEAYNSFVAFDASTYNYNEDMVDLLAELETKLPTGSIVHSINSAGAELTMSITTVSKEVAGQLLLQLQLVPYIAEVQISGLSETKSEQTGTTNVDFTVICSLTKPTE
jgi:type IV pilus assembly protein PilM